MSDFQVADEVALIDLDRVRGATGLKNTFLYELMAQGKFPRPVKVGILSRWVLAEVVAWNRERIKERNAKPFTPKELKKRSFPGEKMAA